MLDLIFLWHMHQPDYREHPGGTLESSFALPWVYLHAIKDYTDMAAHLERHPQIRAVVNFVPVLLEQIEDYVAQFDTGDFRDPLLRIAAHPDPDALPAADRAWRGTDAGPPRSRLIYLVLIFPTSSPGITWHGLVKACGAASH